MIIDKSEEKDLELQDLRNKISE